MKSFSMPIGAYTDCCVVPTCGLGGENGLLATDDRPGDFYVPERTQAQILWSSGGYVEYKFPYPLPSGVQPKRLILTFEACSEAPNCPRRLEIRYFCMGQWPGLRYLALPGDFGQRRGKNNPAWWQNGATQYGLLNTVEITPEHTLTNTRVSSGVTIGDLCLKENIPITVRIGNKEDAEYRGGFNLFGRGFGDYDQDIILTLVY